MKFGLMYEIQIPEPDIPGIEQRVYNQTLAQVELADELGYDYFWSVEHHFLKGFAHCPAPEVLYGAISQRTKRIRIGHAVVLLPHRFNHPIRVAERAAVLDILSDGRMDLGTGRAITLLEMNAFETDPEDTLPQWEEAISMIPRMWTEDPFSHEGHYFKIPPRSIIPKPVQKPHPPLWMACNQPRSFTKAGEMGLGALCFAIGPVDQVAERVNMYREGLKHAQPVGSFVNDQLAAFVLVHCGEDDKEAKEVGGREGDWFMVKSTELYRPWTAPGVKVPDSYQHSVKEMQEAPQRESYAEEFIANGTFAMGDPDACIKAMKQYEAIGIDQILCYMQMGHLSHQRVMDSIKLFGKYVIPYFR